MAADREKFVKLAESRTRKAIKDIQLIGNLSNRATYQFEDSDIEQIFGVLESEIKNARRRFQEPKHTQTPEFSLK